MMFSAQYHLRLGAFSLKPKGASPTSSESESEPLGFDLISTSMGSTGARPNINSNGVNLVESFLLVRWVNRMDLMCTSQSSWLSFTNFTRALVSVRFNISSRLSDRGWYAELILWSEPHNLSSFPSTLLTNSRPWSDITISATPHLVIRS